MKVNLDQSYIHGGKIYPAGEEVEIPEDMAKRLGLVTTTPKPKESRASSSER
ncbi:MAG: hypothetical protein KME06_09470 [Kastovskya adunca ATA6-11-RM4]|jgi:hypothetical protein|nr:hypothetical protein [Kastovskya adunca ATA6-11-RM4]